MMYKYINKTVQMNFSVVILLKTLVYGNISNLM